MVVEKLALILEMEVGVEGMRIPPRFEAESFRLAVSASELVSLRNL